MRVLPLIPNGSLNFSDKSYIYRQAHVTTVDIIKCACSHIRALGSNVYKRNRTCFNLLSEVQFLSRLIAVIISLARLVSSISCNTSTSVSQVTGHLPLPSIHCWRTSMFIRSGLSLCLLAIFWIRAPYPSSRRSIPNFK